MFLTRFLILTIGIFMCCTKIHAQRQNVQNYTSRDGLADQIVNAAFQDKDGYIWFATQSGITVYNGNTFEDFIPSEELKGIDAVSLTQTSDGAIWIGTNTDGVFRYDFSKLSHYTTKNGLPSEVIRSFYIDQNGKLWVATEEGVAHFSNAKWNTFEDSKKLLNDGVLSISQTPDGTMWFGTQGHGIISNLGKTFSYYESEVVDPYIFSLKTFGKTLYIGTTSEGLHSYSNGKFSKIDHSEINHAWISNIIELTDGIAIISSNGLIKQKKNGSFELISEKNGIASNDLYNGLRDRENNLWLTSGNGVTCLRNEEIISYDESAGLSDEKITAVHALKDGRIIVASYGKGINLLSASGEVLKTVLPAELENQMITSLLEVPATEELWIGLNLAEFGILVLDLQKNSFAVKRKMTHLNAVPLKSVTKLELAKNGDIWIGSYTNGLFKISGETARNYSKKEGLPSNAVYTFTLNQDDLPIVSLYQKGIYVLSGKGFTSLSKKHSLKERFVQSIACGDDGTIYLGNKTEGLTVVFPSGNVRNFGTKEGLLSNLVQSIQIDKKNVWCGSDQGLNKLIFQGEKLVKLELYNDKSGFINSEVQQNALQLSGRQLWVGASTGLSRINVDINRATTFQARIDLQSIKLFFEDVDWKKKKITQFTKRGVPSELNLSYTDNHLTFVFNALTTRPVKYSYFLKGSDNNWTPYVDAKEATYSNLAPGSYTFMVKSLDCYGNVSAVLEVPIVIRPPFWATWWFRILVVLLGIALFYWIVKRRERNYRERQHILESTVVDRTKEAVEATARAEEQRQLVEHKNKEIVDSIEYAKRIQSAMLPTLESVQVGFPESSIFYQPKDIVAGDFYWFLEIDDMRFIAVADCTGHGVPGALMSVVCYNALNRAVREHGKRITGEILDQTREIILTELAKSDQGMRDGMDISLLMVNESNQTIQWSGANTPLWKIHPGSNELSEIKGDKQPIGQHINHTDYTSHSIDYQKGTLIVLFSDGYSDQFGGEDGKKFKSPNFKKLLIEHHHKSIQEIGICVQQNFTEWKGQNEQVDDVCIILIRI